MRLLRWIGVDGTGISIFCLDGSHLVGWIRWSMLTGHIRKFWPPETFFPPLFLLSHLRLSDSSPLSLAAAAAAADLVGAQNPGILPLPLALSLPAAFCPPGSGLGRGVGRWGVGKRCHAGIMRRGCCRRPSTPLLIFPPTRFDPTAELFFFFCEWGLYLRGFTRQIRPLLLRLF